MVAETKLGALQWEILHGLFPTKIPLTKWKLSQTDKCLNCDVIDNYGHYLFHCIIINNIWLEVEKDILCVVNKRKQISENITFYGMERGEFNETAFRL